MATDSLKKEIWESFRPQQCIYLATTDDDQPRVRPVTLVHFQKRLYFITGSEDAKIRQIKNNPKVEFCLLLEKGDHKGTLRCECIANIADDKNLKTRLFNEVSFIKEFFKSPEDPRYVVVWVKAVGFEYMKPGEMQAVKINL